MNLCLAIVLNFEGEVIVNRNISRIDASLANAAHSLTAKDA
jgi:hypothetical protein